jgi:hypothetical protein
MLVKFVALATLLLAACGGDDDNAAASRERRCEQLRDHFVDLRLGSVDKADLEKHRRVMRRALGDSFVTSCASTMSDDVVTCALSATDATAAAACTRQSTAN